jgi:hypothetical protein
MGENASAACSWPWTNHGDLLTADATNLCVVLEPVVAGACLFQVYGNPLALVALLAIRTVSVKRNARVAPAGSRRRTSQGSAGVGGEVRLRRANAEKTEQIRFAIAVLTLGLSFFLGLISEASRSGEGQWSVPPTVLGNSSSVAAGFLCFHLGFFLQAMLFLQRYMAFSEASARGAGAVVERNAHEDKVLMRVTTGVLLVSNMPFIGLLAGSSVRFARYTYVLNLGTLVFVLGAVFAPRTIRPTLVALEALLRSGFETEAAALHIKKVIRRLGLLTQAAKVIGLQLPLVCILVAAFPVIQGFTPYLVAQARVIPTLFIVLEQFVLMPISKPDKADGESSPVRVRTNESSKRSSMSGPSKAGPDHRDAGAGPGVRAPTGSDEPASKPRAMSAIQMFWGPQGDADEAASAFASDDGQRQQQQSPTPQEQQQ